LKKETCRETILLHNSLYCLLVIIMEDHKVPNSHSLNEDDRDNLSLKGSSSNCDSDSDTQERNMVSKINRHQLLHIVANIQEFIDHRFGAGPMRNSVLTGETDLAELLIDNSQKQRFQEIFRMSCRVFYKLCDELEGGGYLRSTRHIAVNKQVAMFRWIVSHNRSSCEVQERFQHRAGSVSQ